jgi:hypothetical protein
MNESYLKKLPFAGKIVVATLLLSIGIGFTSAIVNLHFQSANAGQPLPGPEETVSEFHGSKEYSQIERLLIANETKPFNGTGSMRSVFTSKRAGGIKRAIKEKRILLTELAEEKLKDKPEALAKEISRIENDPEVEKLVYQDIDGERIALLAWIKNGYKKEYYENSQLQGYPLTSKLESLKISPTMVHTTEDGSQRFANIEGIIESRCVRCHDAYAGGSAANFPLNTYEEFTDYCAPEKSSAKSLEKLALSSHVHLLGFAMLYGITGFCLAMTGFPNFLKVIIAPSALIIQVIEISCWWFARMDAPLGPLFASAIPVLGGLVALGLLSQILLSLWDMFEIGGRKFIITLLIIGAIFGGIIGIKVILPYLKEEAGQIEN